MKLMLRKITTLFLMLLLAAGPAFVLSGCEKDSGLEDAAEETQDAVEDTADEAGDAMDDATD